MIFLPLTVAATVLSGEFELDEQAAPNAATMPISTERVKSFENLCTSFAPYNVGQRLAPAYSLAKNWLASLFYFSYAAFAILPPFMHLAHTRIRFAPPVGS